MDHRPTLVVYGDFNCPFSALASARCAVLEQLDLADVDWRAVEHAPDVPPGGRALIGDQRQQLEHELEQVRSLLVDGEPDEQLLPPIQANTRLATLAYAGCSPERRPTLRVTLFEAYWKDQLNLSDPEVLTRLGAASHDEAVAGAWQAEWCALPRPIVPVMVLPDGYVSRGLGALARLAQYGAGGADQHP